MKEWGTKFPEIAWDALRWEAPKHGPLEFTEDEAVSACIRCPYTRVTSTSEGGEYAFMETLLIHGAGKRLPGLAARRRV